MQRYSGAGDPLAGIPHASDDPRQYGEYWNPGKEDDGEALERLRSLPGKSRFSQRTDGVRSRRDGVPNLQELGTRCAYSRLQMPIKRSSRSTLTSTSANSAKMMSRSRSLA